MGSTRKRETGEGLSFGPRTLSHFLPRLLRLRTGDQSFERTRTDCLQGRAAGEEGRGEEGGEKAAREAKVRSRESEGFSLSPHLPEPAR